MSTVTDACRLESRRPVTVTCGQCGTDLAEAIYAFGLVNSQRVTLLCRRCAHERAPGWSRSRPCRHCGRPRFYNVNWPRQYCTDECAALARAQRRRTRAVTETRHAPDGLTVTAQCLQCGARLVRQLELFGRPWAQRYRRGARYCSSACKQKAYRRRQSTSDGDR